jgi:hypothetical protein
MKSVEFKRLIGVALITLLTISFVSCNDDDEEKQVNMTMSVEFIQGGERFIKTVMVQIFQGGEDFYKNFNYNTKYDYFVDKEGVLYPPKYRIGLQAYGYGKNDEKQYEIRPIEDKFLYTISYKLTGTDFYFIEYDVEVNGKDIMIERRFIIDSEGNITKE